MSDKRPNILVAISDDQAWPHAGAYGCKFVNTPAFDRVAAEGVLFTNAFCPAPQCSPARAGLLTGLNPWELEEGCLLWSLLPDKYDVYPDLLEEVGYFIGLTNKGWGPGSWEDSGRGRNPAGPQYNKRKNTPPTSAMNSNDYAANFADFLSEKPDDKPFCFWYGSKEPHRRYEQGSGLRAGKRLEDVEVPPYLPDCEEVRSDLLDYGLEIDWFDAHLGRMIAMLEERGELDNTIIVVTGDNGMPFPRAKANLYENGLHVPLAIRWGDRVLGGRVVTDFVSFIDLAHTFLEAAAVKERRPMTGRSIMEVLLSGEEGRVDPTRNYVLTGKERHAYCRPDNIGHPCRCIKTDDFLYIHNYEPDRWPAGDPEEYGDIDGGPSKTYMMEHRNDEGVKESFHLAFGKRPAEELYAASDGTGNMRNLAADPAYDRIKDDLRKRLEEELHKQGDPRTFGRGWIFDTYPYYGAISGKFPGFKERARYNIAVVPKGEKVEIKVKPTTVALFGAAGKMGTRIANSMRSEPRYRMLYVEAGGAGVSLLRERGDEPTGAERAAREADIVILAVPDALIAEVSAEVVPRLRRGAMIVCLDPAAPYGGELPDRKDVTYFITHPCHPPVISDDTDPRARLDFFGGKAKQNIVCALMQGSEEHYAKGEALCRRMFAPVMNAHRITVEQMALLEPALTETVALTCMSVICEAMDEVISKGVPEAAARDFLLGHLNASIGILFGFCDAEVSDGAKLAVKRAMKSIFQPDWKRVFEKENLVKEVKAITQRNIL